MMFCKGPTLDWWITVLYFSQMKEWTIDKSVKCHLKVSQLPHNPWVEAGKAHGWHGWPASRLLFLPLARFLKLLRYFESFRFLGFRMDSEGRHEQKHTMNKGDLVHWRQWMKDLWHRSKCWANKGPYESLWLLDVAYSLPGEPQWFDCSIDVANRRSSWVETSAQVHPQRRRIFF